MIRVTVEMVPQGNEAMKHTLGVLHIANDGTGTPEEGNYLIAEMTPDARQCRSYRLVEIPREPHMAIFDFLECILVGRFEHLAQKEFPNNGLPS